MAPENSSPADAAQVVRFASFELDLRSGELRKSGVRLRLQEQPFQVLALLVERRGEMVSREELRQRLWPADTFVDFDHGLNTAINKLREALGDSAATPRFIETLPRRGYRFIFPLAGDANPAPAQAAPDAAQKSAAPSSHHRLRTFFLLLQVMYLIFYVSALANFRQLAGIVNALAGRGGTEITALALVTGAIGIAVRLYLISAAGFGIRALPQQFMRIFPALFFLDELWALSPFLLWQRMGLGTALACTATLVWVPFAQRTLLRMSGQVTS